MSFPSLIHFFGPDGAGKSTQARMLVSYLRKKGVPARIWWVRSPHTLAFVCWRLFVKIGFYRAVMNPFKIPIRLPAINRNRALRLIWSTIEFFGVLPLVLKTHLLINIGHKLVAERYLLDTITTIAYFEEDSKFVDSFIGKILLKTIPQDTAFIFLDSDFYTIFKRRAQIFTGKKKVSSEHIEEIKRPSHREKYGQVPSSAVEPSDFINFQRAIYRKLAYSTSALVIDTSKSSVEETFHSILQFLGFI